MSKKRGNSLLLSNLKTYDHLEEKYDEHTASTLVSTVVNEKIPPSAPRLTRHDVQTTIQVVKHLRNIDIQEGVYHAEKEAKNIADEIIENITDTSKEKES